MTSFRCLVTALLGFVLLISRSQAQPTVDFTQDVAPLLAKNCLACHNAQTAEGGLNLESHKVLMAGGDSGDAIVAGNVEESYLYARASGAEEPLMPPEDNSVGAKPFNDAQLELLRTWINEGALTGKANTLRQMKWQALPSNLQPVYALDSSPDGQLVAFGHGNSLIVAPMSDANAPSEFLMDPVLEQPQAAHLDIVQSIAFSPDSRRLATGGFRTVKIWRRRTEAAPLLTGLSESVQLSRLSVDGSLLATSVDPSVLEITDISEGLSHRFLTAHDAPIAALTWLGESHQLVSCDQTGRWTLIDGDTRKVTSLNVEPELVAVDLLALTSEQLIAVDPHQKVYQLQLSSNAGHQRTELTQLSGMSHLVALGSARTQFLAVSKAGHGVVFDLANEQIQTEIELGEDLVDVVSSEDGSQLAVLRSKGPVEVWQVDNGQLAALLEEDYLVRQQVRTASNQVVRQKNWVDLLSKQVPDLKKAHEKEVDAQNKVAEAREQAADKLAAEAKSSRAASQAVSMAEQAVAEAEAAVEAAKRKAEEMVAQLESTKKAAAEAQAKRQAAQSELEKREQALATATESAERAAAAIPELETKISAERKRLENLESALTGLKSQALPPPASAVTFSSNRIAVASQDQVVRVYAADGQPMANLSAGEAAQGLYAQSSQQRLLALTSKGRLLSWDLNLGWELERTIGSDLQSPLSDRVTALDFSPDGQLLAMGSGPPSRAGELKLYELDSGEFRNQFGDIHSDTVFAVRFSPDGRSIATGSADKLCKLFDVESGKLIRSFEGHTHHVLDVAWRDDGQQIATASADSTVKLWKVTTGSQDRALSSFKKEPTALSYIGQSHQLAIAAADGSVRLVNADDGKTIRNFSGAKDALFRLSTLGPHGQILAGGQAGRVWAWEVDDAKLTRTLPSSTP